MAIRFPEVTGFGTPDADWPALPDRHTVPEVAAHYMRHRISAYLRHRNITASLLSKQLGDTEAAWRSRLNSTRGLNTDDLVALFMLFPELPKEVIPSTADVDDWLPASYAGLAAGRVDGSGLPEFLVTDINWIGASSAIAGWWSAAIADGTASWSVTLKVLAHQILSTLDDFGLPRRLATPASSLPKTTSAQKWPSIRTDWLLHDTSVTALWFDPFQAPHADDARAMLKGFASAVWSERTEAASTNVVVVAAPPQVIATIRELLMSGADASRSVVMSLTHAERLGVADTAVSKPDAQVTTLDDGSGPLLWMLIKS